jgi:WD40 repeat protein
MAYDGFVSYSHVDARVATALQTEVQRFAKPWYRRRALRLFRDETTLVTAPELWPPIEQALGESEWFILLASPESATSRWVTRELDWWIEQRGPERILPVVTSGTWIWDDASTAFADGSTAVPASLRTAFTSEPRHLDLTWIDDDTVLSVRSPAFAAAVADLAAPLRGVPKDDLVGEDVQRHRQARRLAASAVAALGAMLVVALVAATLAVRAQGRAEAARDRAELSARHADAARLSAVARAEAPTQIDVALLLAVEARRLHDTLDTRAALLETLNQSPELAGVEQRLGRDIFDLRVRPDRKAIALARMDGSTEIWPMDGAEPSVRLPERPSPAGLAYSSDGQLLATAGSADELVEIRDDTGKVRATAEASGAGLSMVQFAADDKVLVGAGYEGTVYQWRVSDGAEVRPPIELTNASLLGFTLSPDGRIGYFTTTEGELVAVMLESGATLWRFTAPADGRLWMTALDPTGQLLAVAGDSGALWFLDPKTGEQNGLPVVTGSSPQVWVAFSPSGQRVASVGVDNVVHVIDPTSRSEVTVLRGAAGDGFMVLFVDDRHLLLVADQVYRWDLQSAGPAGTVRRFDRPVARPVATASGLVVACDAERPDVLVLPAEGAATRLIFGDDAYARCANVVAEPGTERLAVQLSDRDNDQIGVFVLDAGTGDVVMHKSLRGNWDLGMAFSPSGEQLAFTAGYNDPAVAAEGLGLRVLSVPSGRDLNTISVPPGPGLLAIGFLDEQTVAVGGLGTPASLDQYDLRSGEQVRSLAADDYGFNRIDVTPDRQSLVVSTESGEYYVAQVAAPDRGSQVSLFQDRAYGILVGADLVGVSANMPEDVVLGDVATARTVGPLGRHPLRTAGSPILDMRVAAPTGQSVLLVDGTTNAWEFSTDPDDWSRAACRTVGRSLTRTEWAAFVGDRPYHPTCG